MNTYFENYLFAFIGALTGIFEKLNLNTDYLKDRDFTEDTFFTDIQGTEADLLTEYGLEYLNTFNQRASDIFNSLLLNEKKFCKTYNSSSADSQEADFLFIIYYLMQYITHTSPFDCAYMLMEMGTKVKDPYKVRMLLAALDDAEKNNRCA